jgi:hypothetical protein
MPDAISDAARFGGTSMQPGTTGSDAARRWVQDNVPEAGKIRDVTLVGFSDDGAPVYHVTYEIPDDAPGDQDSASDGPPPPGAG